MSFLSSMFSWDLEESADNAAFAETCLIKEESLKMGDGEPLLKKEKKSIFFQL